MQPLAEKSLVRPTHEPPTPLTHIMPRPMLVPQTLVLHAGSHE